MLNFTGFLFYSIYSSLGYFDNDPGAGTVDLSDIAFGYHALFIISITGVQCIIYPWGKNKVGNVTWLFTAVLFGVAIFMILMEKVR